MMTNRTTLGRCDTSGQYCEFNDNQTVKNGHHDTIKEQLPALFTGYGYRSPRKDVFSIFVLESIAYLLLLIILVTYGLGGVNDVIWYFVMLLLFTTIHGYCLFLKSERSNRLLGFVMTQVLATIMFSEDRPPLMFTRLLIATWTLQTAALYLDWNVYFSIRDELKAMEAKLRQLDVVVPSEEYTESMKREQEEQQMEQMKWLERERRGLSRHMLSLIGSFAISLGAVIVVVTK
ncbi:hypothetical protein IV203_033327 [Nitzschia inconspicua]|uniref:Uncharacterized protein n=1 Tax=Nitzschia inconspicua TaxID=303405 RepID=A0A9K3KLX6_9STRA|nr:hypothetical protein IV203_033327 [Nitzschia inconspicua]